MRWTEEEVAILKTNKSFKELVELLPHRTLDSIMLKSRKLGLCRDKKWTEQEIAVLINNQDKSLTELSKMLNRSYDGVHIKRIKLGLRKNNKVISWTAEELKIIQDNGSKLYARELCSLLPRHSIKAIGHKLHRLGISKYDGFWSDHMRRNQQSPNWRTATHPNLDQNFGIFDLSNDTYQILIGSMLGDGCATRKKTGHTCHFAEEHGWKQRDYIVWKRQMFSVFAPWLSGDELKIATPVHSIFSSLREEFYDESKSKKAYIPFKYIEKLDEFGLLIWYLDDGHIHHYSPTIASGLFMRSDLQKTIDIINNNLQLSLHIQGPCLDKRRNSLIYTIYFPVTSRDKIIPIWEKMFDDYKIPDCMRYKIKKLTKR